MPFETQKHKIVLKKAQMNHEFEGQCMEDTWIRTYLRLIRERLTFRGQSDGIMGQASLR